MGNWLKEGKGKRVLGKKIQKKWKENPCLTFMIFFPLILNGLKW